MYLKSCSARGLSHPCIACTYYCDPQGCKKFRDDFQATIEYPEVDESLIPFFLDVFFGGLF
jgi:hypothetical protein